MITIQFGDYLICTASSREKISCRLKLLIKHGRMVKNERTT